MKLHIVMVTMNRKEKALSSLNAVLKQTVKPNKIIIVDSSDDDSLGRAARKISSRKTKLIYIHKKASMPEARNIGIKKSRAENNDIILFIDDDIVLYPDYIENLLHFYNKNPNADGASGYLCDGNRFLIDRISKFPHIPSLDKPFKVNNLYGSNMSLKKKVFNKFTFHEGLKGYYAEDDEFSARISRIHNIYLIPNARCIHKHTPTGGARQDPFTDFNTMIFNRYYIYRIKEKTVLGLLHYIFSDTLILLRILIFNKHKARALSGAVRGYRRIINNLFKDDITEELKKL